MDTYEAWKDGRPTLARLPGINDGYSGNAIADWLTAPPDDLLYGLKQRIDALPTQTDPETVDASWLDFLAQLAGHTGEYWQLDWPELAKRSIIQESYRLLWPRKGTSEVLSFMLSALGVLHRIRQKSSFIVDESEVGDELGLSGWQYEVVMPSVYFGTSTERLVSKLVRLYGPCWCIADFIFDDQYFSPIELLRVGQDAALAVGDRTALEV